MEKLILKAEVLASGKGCPICGGHKTEKAMTCRSCISEIGRKATDAVKEVISASLAAREGHENAVASSGDVERLILQPAVLAQFKFPRRARHITKVPNNIQPYFDFGMDVNNGFCNVSVFGADGNDRDQVITGLVEVKRRKNDKLSVPYVRIQKVSPIITSTAFLMIRKHSNGNMYPNNVLPRTYFKGQIKGKRMQMISGCIGYVMDHDAIATQKKEHASVL